MTDCSAIPTPVECRPVRAGAAGRASEAGGDLYEHSWARDGWDELSSYALNVDSGTVFTKSVTAAGRGRFTGVGSGGNRRELCGHPSTRWLDSEIGGVWWGPSEWTTNRPQLGFAHRVQPRTDGPGYMGIATWLNIFLSLDPATIQQNVFRGNGASTFQAGTGQGVDASAWLRRDSRVVGTSYVNSGGHQYTYDLAADHASTIDNGTLVDVTGFTNTDWNASGVAVASAAPGQGSVTLTRGVAPTPTTTQAGGRLAPRSPRNICPYGVVSQVTGGYAGLPLVSRIMSWPLGQPRPQWGGRETQVVTLTPSVDYPSGFPTAPGECCLWLAHAWNNSYGEFSDWWARRIPPIVT